jgi:hypothetical protein
LAVVVSLAFATAAGAREPGLHDGSSLQAAQAVQAVHPAVSPVARVRAGAGTLLLAAFAPSVPTLAPPRVRAGADATLRPTEPRHLTLSARSSRGPPERLRPSQ